MLLRSQIPMTTRQEHQPTVYLNPTPAYSVPESCSPQCPKFQKLLFLHFVETVSETLNIIYNWLLMGCKQEVKFISFKPYIFLTYLAVSQDWINLLALTNGSS